MSECTHDCSSCSASCEERGEPQSLIQQPNARSEIGKVYAVVSGKGGVGKSMVTSQLAVAMRRAGYRVGVLDADVTGPSIPKAFGVTEAGGTDGEVLYPAVSAGGIEIMSINLLLENDTVPVVWRGPVISGVVQQFWTDVVWHADYLFVDMPPGTGDVPLSVFQSIVPDGIIIVTSPQELVGMVVEKAVNMAEMMHIPIVGLVENMSYLTCPDCGKEIHLFGEGKTEEAAARHGLECLAKMPIDPALAALADQGRIEAFQGDWLSGVTARLEELARADFEGDGE
ncbi:MAG: P-loop NTPase [Oscillospiraceae bacterium]